MRRALTLAWLLAALLVVSSTWAAELSFTTRTLDAKAGEVVYAVIAADVDGDRRPDVVAVTENRVVWYQNPDWTPR
ncbi:MAG: FG-GAP repeat domain-containing protein, partial [Planctomycetaceae bacterium]